MTSARRKDIRMVAMLLVSIVKITVLDLITRECTKGLSSTDLIHVRIKVFTNIRNFFLVKVLSF